MNTYGEDIKKHIDEADAVIVGIGSEFAADVENISADNEIYLFYKSCISEYKNIAAFNIEQYIKHSIYFNELCSGKNKIINRYIETYRKIHTLIGNKRYFILTINTDDIIYEGGFDENNIAAPCGSILRFQAGCGCGSDCKPAKPELEEIYKILVELKNKKEKITRDIVSGYFEVIKGIIPKCENCHTLKVFNVHGEKEYDEGGYIPQWEKYTRWLQLTLNKKLVLLELGVGFDVPMVIRWPFEKIAMLNYKAWLYRINQKLPQLPLEIKDKGTSINENSFEFINSNL